MTNPVLVETTRGKIVENRHRGAVAISDSSGKLKMEIGDVDRPVFPRSAVKAMQALPLVESGAAEAFMLEDKHLALACASHSGEKTHVSTAQEILQRAGFDETALDCGSHWPLSRPAMIELAATGGSPGPLHNNCSGKHAGFLCTCQHLGIGHTGYVDRGHELQQAIRDILENLTGSPHSIDQCGRDGCSIPTYATPLRSLARGFARMTDGQGINADRRKAASRLLSACMAEPFYVAGKDRGCSNLMQAAPGRIFVKIGADGVYCGAVPELGFGIALKVDDGAERAAIAVMAAVLSRLFAEDAALHSKLNALAQTGIKNWNGITIGDVRPAGPLAV